MAVPRDYNFWLVALFLSRCGFMPGGSGTALPPEQLGVGTWKEAYDFFYSAVGQGRSRQSFRRSLKNARDALDGHLALSGRVGWRESGEQRPPQLLSGIAAGVMTDWSTRSDEELFHQMSGLEDTIVQTVDSELEAAQPADVGIALAAKKRPLRQGTGLPSSRSPKANLVGKRAEKIVFAYLKKNLGENSGTLIHHARIGQTPGYDISYEDPPGNRQAVEVKGTVGPTMTRLTVTANEVAAAEEMKSSYTLWLVISVEGAPIIRTINDPAKLWSASQLTLTPSEYQMTGFRAGKH